MANARQASLQAQRGYAYGSGSKIKILAPVNTSISTIAKQTASAELSSMVDKYNAGEVGNDAMLSFLTSQVSNPAFSPSDVASIQDQIRNFNSLVQKDSLEASFNSAPENSLAKIQAAQALSNFYGSRASSLASGTPAQSTALSNKASWDTQIQNITNTMQTTQRTNMRYTAEQQINQLPSNSSEKAMQKANMWKALADQATADGDPNVAAQYMANYQQETTNAQQLAANESTTGEKTAIRDYFGQLQNLYHDGKINEQQYLQALADIGDRVDATGDYGLINTFNRTTDTIQKNLDKGGLNRGTTASGLPTVLKGYGGSGAGTVTDWDKQAFDYADNIRLATEMLHVGKTASGQPYTPDMYAQDVAQSVTEYSTALQDEYATMDSIAQTNPNQKVLFEGKKQRVADVVDQLAKNMDNVAGQVEALNNGTAALMEVPPKQSATNPNGKAVTTYAFVDKNNIDPNTTTADTSGVLHQILKETVPLSQLIQDPSLKSIFNSPATTSSYIAAGGYYDAQGIFHRITKDSAGNPIAETNSQKVITYEPGGTRSITLPNTGEPFGPFSNQAFISQDQVHVQGTEAAAQMAKAKAFQAKQTALAPASVGPKTATPSASLQPNLSQPTSTTQSGTPIIKPVPVPVGTPTPTLTPTIAPKPVSYSTGTPGLSSSTPVSSSSVAAKPISFATPTPVNIPTAISSGGLTPMYSPTPTPPKVVAPKVTAPSIGTILTGAIGQAANKVKSWLGW